MLIYILIVMSALLVREIETSPIISNPFHGQGEHIDTALTRRGLLDRLNRGEATFYDVGLGACETVNANSEFVGALNSVDFGQQDRPRNSPACSSCVTVWSPSALDKPPVLVKLVDKCPTCNRGDIDLSPAVFNHFFPPEKGRFDILWMITPCSGGPLVIDQGTLPSGPLPPPPIQSPNPIPEPTVAPPVIPTDTSSVLPSSTEVKSIGSSSSIVSTTVPNSTPTPNPTSAPSSIPTGAGSVLPSSTEVNSIGSSSTIINTPIPNYTPTSEPTTAPPVMPTGYDTVKSPALEIKAIESSAEVLTSPTSYLPTRRNRCKIHRRLPPLA